MSGNSRPQDHVLLDRFYQMAMGSLGAFLINNGFTEQSLEFRRDHVTGFDRLEVMIPERRRFSILISYYPNSVEWVFKTKIKPHFDPDFGYPCGPYLNPFRVDARPRSWPIGDNAVTEKSLAEALKALKDVGLPWLSQSKDPSFFAEAVDKQIFDLYGAALEATGRFGEATVQYLRKIEILERCRDIPRLAKAKQEEVQDQIDMLTRRIANLPKE